MSSTNSFFRLLEALQKKPDKEKDKIIIITVGVLMILILGIWISLPNEKNTGKQSLEQQAGPFRVLWEEIKSNAPKF